MKIYYCANLEKLEDDYWKDRYFLINQLLLKNGVNLVSNLEKIVTKGENEARRSISYDQIEAVIIEGTYTFSDTIYIIATALAYKKPVLYLMEKGHLIPDQLEYIRKDENLGENFFLKFYKKDKKSIEDTILDFLELIESGNLLTEKVNVKFTLRISPRTERYLNWKSLGVKKSKARYLREMLDKMMKEDPKYKTFLKKTHTNFQ